METIELTLTKEQISDIRFLQNEMAIEGYIMTFEAAAKAYLESEREENAKELAGK